MTINAQFDTESAPIIMSDAAMSSFRCILLDIDGTLVDSNDAHAHAWVEAFAAEGIPVRFVDVRPLMGMGGDKLMPKVSGISSDSEQGRRIDKTRMEILIQKYLPAIKPTRGATDLLQFLKQRDFRLVVASSAKKQELDALLTICHADQFVDDMTSSDEADESKPAPDIIEAAIEKSGFPRRQNNLLGNTPFDIIAAWRA